jgi:DNA polymerase III subunit delta
MRLTADKLATQLERGLAPVYFITGDEPLLVQEAADAVRATAREQGYSEREILFVERGFDWGRLGASASTLSLFADRRVIELRMATAKPGTTGSKALVAYCERIPEDTILLITAPKLEAKTRDSKWVKTLDQAGVMVPVWPVSRSQMPAWVEGRMRARELAPDDAAVRLIAERSEGNLLAAVQEIEKLLLTHGPGPVDEGRVREAVMDGARFDVFQLADAALAGDAARALRVLHGLHGEGVAPTLVNWALARDIRLLVKFAGTEASGGSLPAVMTEERVFESRRPLFKDALKRHRMRRLVGLLERAGKVDLCIKGRLDGDAWDRLAALAVAFAGVPGRRRAA